MVNKELINIEEMVVGVVSFSLQTGAGQGSSAHPNERSPALTEVITLQSIPVDLHPPSTREFLCHSRALSDSLCNDLPIDISSNHVLSSANPIKSLGAGVGLGAPTLTHLHTSSNMSLTATEGLNDLLKKGSLALPSSSPSKKSATSSSRRSKAL